HMAEAEAAALEMADAAPYDVITQTRAIPYLQLTAEWTPGKQAYFDRLVKIFPEALGLRAIAHQWAGQYLEAARDYADVVELRTAFSTTNNPAPPLPATMAL